MRREVVVVVSGESLSLSRSLALSGVKVGVRRYQVWK